MNINNQIFEKIKEYQKIVIFGHVSPDGDCYGSQTGLKTFLKEVFPNKEIYIVGSGFSRAIPYFDKMDIIGDEIIENALAIVVDVSDLERIEDNRVTKAKEIVKFDHHLNSDKPSFAVLNMSDTLACSACQMIGQFVLDNGYQISKAVGERIFMGIVTDSGRFTYLSSSRGMFHVLDEIMKADIDFQKIFDFLYEGDERLTRAKGYISYNFKTTETGIAYITLSKEELADLGIDFNYASSLVNSLSGMKGYPVWASFAEAENGYVRVELRSKSINVQQVAIQFNGGGHLKASGCKLDNLEDHIYVIKALEKAMKESE